MDSENFIVYLLYIGLPALAVLWFLVNMIVFLTAPKKSKRRENFKSMTIVSAVLAVILVGMVGVLFVVALIAAKSA